MGDEDDPFVTLGLSHDGTLTAEHVHSAFRRAALSTHPDKAGPASSDAFARLKDARDRALSILMLGDDGHGRDGTGGEAAAMTVNAGVSWAMQWAAQVAFEAVRSREARPIVLDLDVSMEDVYHARVKKVVISVLRVGGERPFERTRQTLYVRLLSRDGPDGSLDVVFPGAGDDPPAAILLGLQGWSRLFEHRGTPPPPPRSDVTVRVRVLPHHAFRRDLLVRKCDLHADATISIQGHYLGETIELAHPSGTPVTVRTSSSSDDDNDNDNPEDCGIEEGMGRGRRGGRRQVRVLHGMGLPYLDANADADADRPQGGGGGGGGHRRRDHASASYKRGDAYVFIETRLPTLDLGRQDVLDALATLAKASTVDMTPSEKQAKA